MLLAPLAVNQRSFRTQASSKGAWVLVFAGAVNAVVAPLHTMVVLNFIQPRPAILVLRVPPQFDNG
jgi:hypothetical protein